MAGDRSSCYNSWHLTPNYTTAQRGNGRSKPGVPSCFSFFEPNVKISCNKEGKATFINAYGDSSSMSASGSAVKGDLAIKNGHVTGRCTYTPDDKKNGVDVQFDASLLVVPQSANTEKPKKDKEY